MKLTYYSSKAQSPPSSSAFCNRSTQAPKLDPSASFYDEDSTATTGEAMQRRTLSLFRLFSANLTALLLVSSRTALCNLCVPTRDQSDLLLYPKLEQSPDQLYLLRSVHYNRLQNHSRVQINYIFLIRSLQHIPTKIACNSPLPLRSLPQFQNRDK
ncbi:hypothetical protein AAC387_Pa01g1526 [Persea americana]